MNVFELFSCFAKIPVPLVEIRDHILESGAAATIDVIPADLDPRICGGFLRMFEWVSPYGEPGRRAEIYYSKYYDESTDPQRMGERRLIICKELLHILDDHSSIAGTRAIMERLIPEICAPLSLSMSIPSVQDHLAVWPALCVLVPRDVISDLRHLHAAGMGVEALAEMALVPAGYMAVALSDVWQEIVEKGIK